MSFSIIFAWIALIVIESKIELLGGEVRHLQTQQREEPILNEVVETFLRGDEELIHIPKPPIFIKFLDIGNILQLQDFLELLEETLDLGYFIF